MMEVHIRLRTASICDMLGNLLHQIERTAVGCAALTHICCSRELLVGLLIWLASQNGLRGQPRVERLHSDKAKAAIFPGHPATSIKASAKPTSSICLNISQPSKIQLLPSNVTYASHPRVIKAQPRLCQADCLESIESNVLFQGLTNA